MKRIVAYYIAIVCCFVLLLCTSCNKQPQENDFSERVKVAVRAVGNDVLLSQNDTTSLVMPVLQVSSNTYELSFEKPLAFDPSNLNAAVTNNFTKAALPQNYRVEVLKFNDGEVAYSFEIQQKIENSLVPCGGRLLPEGCYTIRVKFTKPIGAGSNSLLFYVLVVLVLSFLVFVFYSKYHAFQRDELGQTGTSIGIFRFYPEQNKLVKETEEIHLSKKESELLAMLIAKPNQIIKREELTKKVWEDNGVIVGRSLDTYISKLRKKLQDDSTLKITNVHGVGYTLEIDILV